MKTHLSAFILGAIMIWLLTAFTHAELNPFNLTEEVRSSMVGGFVMFQIIIQLFIGIYKLNKL